jgi:hypothetical protein
MSSEFAELECEVCQDLTEHELHYAGRLLESVRCTRCGHHVAMTPRALLPAYLQDLEQRVATKPRRLLRRSRQDPQRFRRDLPRAIARQPKKFLDELWALIRR